MQKKLLIFILSLFVIYGCNANQVKRSHGISFLEKREKVIIINQSNKNDTRNILGEPATTGMTNNNLWIYIERTKNRGKLLKLGRSYLVKNNVLVLEFDKYGILINKEFYDKDKMKKIEFAENVTENEIKKESFVYSFLSSIRQKMESSKK